MLTNAGFPAERASRLTSFFPADPPLARKVGHGRIVGGGPLVRSDTDEPLTLFVSPSFHRISHTPRAPAMSQWSATVHVSAVQMSHRQSERGHRQSGGSSSARPQGPFGAKIPGEDAAGRPRPQRAGSQAPKPMQLAPPTGRRTSPHDAQRRHRTSRAGQVASDQCSQLVTNREGAERMSRSRSDCQSQAAIARRASTVGPLEGW